MRLDCSWKKKKHSFSLYIYVFLCVWSGGKEEIMKELHNQIGLPSTYLSKYLVKIDKEEWYCLEYETDYFFSSKTLSSMLIILEIYQ